jgi:hypothetical protein
MAKIIVPTPLRKFTSDQSSVMVNGKTISGAILELVNKQPDIKKHLLDEMKRYDPLCVYFWEMKM